jgi:hypothetical protein
MNKKLVITVISLALIISVGLVYAQENGYLLNIINSNATINTTISNSSVIENVTLSNGTLNLQINADNISTVTINGINYTAQPSPSASPALEVTITYYGMNVGAAGVLGFISTPYLDAASNQTVSTVTCYTWNITMTNLIPTSLPSGNFDQALEPLVAKYPNLLTMYIPNPLGGVSDNLTLMWCCSSFNGNLAKCCFALYAKSPLSSDQINMLTQDLTSQLTPAIVGWYS